MDNNKDTTGEAYEYTKNKLTVILNDLLLLSNSDNLLRINSKSNIVLHYKDFVNEEIVKIVQNNKISLDESITIKGAKKYKYFKERLRIILNRIISRLDEHLEYDDENFDSYIQLINDYIYKVGTDYDLELIDLNKES